MGRVIFDAVIAIALEEVARNCFPKLLPLAVLIIIPAYWWEIIHYPRISVLHRKALDIFSGKSGRIHWWINIAMWTVIMCLSCAVSFIIFSKTSSLEQERNETSNSIKMIPVMANNIQQIKNQISLNVLSEVEQKVRTNDDNNVVTSTFWILREKGATISLGPCPSLNCLNIRLDKLIKSDGMLLQRFIMTGDVLSFFEQDNKRPNGGGTLTFGINDILSVKDGVGIFTISRHKELFADISLQKGTELMVSTRKYDISLIVDDVRVDSLKVRLEVRASAGSKSS